MRSPQALAKQAARERERKAFETIVEALKPFDRETQQRIFKAAVIEYLTNPSRP